MSKAKDHRPSQSVGSFASFALRRICIIGLLSYELVRAAVGSGRSKTVGELRVNHLLALRPIETHCEKYILCSWTITSTAPASLSMNLQTAVHEVRVKRRIMFPPRRANRQSSLYQLTRRT
jgi:hypothetical protein